MKKSLGVYIHIPFCMQKCNYCDFCSFPKSDAKLISAYAEELCRRISYFSKKAVEYSVDTVYFGGGTPTLLSMNDFTAVMSEIKRGFSLSDDAEITAECNPATVDLEYLAALRSLGINRLSIGLQSVHENELRALGRIHSFEDLCNTFRDARNAGFDNISVDLMYGIPYQTPESFRESITVLASLRPEHISAYGLKIEKGTLFYISRDSLPLPDEDAECEMYLSMTDILSSYGYSKYEISNFSLKGRESRHNLRYWQGLEYVGFGVAAHSYFGGERFGNSRDLTAFLAGESIECEREHLSDSEHLWEYVILSLRLSEGLELSEFKARTGMDFFDYYKRAEQLIDEGLMRRSDGRIAFTDRGFLVSNSILSDMPELL